MFLLRKAMFGLAGFSALFLGGLSTVCPANPLYETLPNGLKVFILPNPGTSSISVDLWIKTGSRYETPQKNGISHFTEHLLFQGTSRRTAQDISREIAGAGGSFNAYTHWEYTQVHISILPVQLSLALDILADVAQNSLLTEETIQKERKVILEEISLANINPPSYVLNLVCRTLFPEHALGMPISGTKETVTTLSRRDLVQFYKSSYVPQNALLTLVGNIEPQTALDLTSDKFASWPQGEPSSSPPSPARQKEGQEVSKRKFLDQAIVVVAFQTMGLKDPDRPAFEMVNALLGSGSHSRFYQEIREKRGLSYLVGSLYHPLTDTGLWAIYAGTRTSNVKQVQSLIFEQIEKIQKEPLSLREMDENKSYLRGTTLIRNERNASLAAFLSQRILAGSRESPEQFLAEVQKVAPEDIMRVARSYLKKDQGNIIVLKPYPGLGFFRKFY